MFKLEFSNQMKNKPLNKHTIVTCAIYDFSDLIQYRNIKRIFEAINFTQQQFVKVMLRLEWHVASVILTCRVNYKPSSDPERWDARCQIFQRILITLLPFDLGRSNSAG